MREARRRGLFFNYTPIRRNRAAAGLSALYDDKVQSYLGMTAKPGQVLCHLRLAIRFSIHARRRQLIYSDLRRIQSQRLGRGTLDGHRSNRQAGFGSVFRAAVYERISSHGEDSFAGKLLPAFQFQFGGQREKAAVEKEGA